MKSQIVKRSIVIAGHKTSVSLEDAFWKALKDIAAGRDMTLSELVGAIDAERRHGNLSSAVRLFVLDYYQARTAGCGEGGNPPREVMVVPPPGASVLRSE
ncbi:MAG: ribbon-helix-helix domain-containing protein [Xanthobacteraceae bacterium]